MSGAAAIAAGASAQSAAAAAQAHAAQVTACTKFVQGYTHDTATVAEMREYSGCVGLLHPDPLPVGAVWAIKAAIVIVLASMVFGAVRGDGYGAQTLGDRCMAGLVAGALGALALIVIGLVIAGVFYVVA